MSKRSTSIDTLPNAVRVQLELLGDHLAVARKRRRQPVRLWADRIGVSAPTLLRMEKGDPSVSMGVYATALWLMGRSAALGELAAPEHDMGALEDAVRAARQRAVRKKAPAAAPAAPDGAAAA